MQTYAIIQCTNPACNLRCPATDGQRMDRCPWCHAPAVIEVTGAIERERPAEAVDRGDALPLALVLDNVRSAFNVGAILRSANGAGVRDVWLAGFTPGAENARVAKTALGAEMALTLHKRNNALDLVRELGQAGATILVLESDAASQSIFEVELPLVLPLDFPLGAPLVLVAGNEVVGVDPAIRALAHALVELPMRGSKLSYNVATAVGAALILLGERLQQLQRVQQLQELQQATRDQSNAND